MKKLILFVLFAITIGSNASAQGMPVYDNTNFISLVKSLVESAKQTTQLVKTVKFLKQQKENLEKVNNVVKQLRAVRQIGRNNQRLIKVIRGDLRKILDSPYIKPNEISRVTNSFSNLIDHSLETMDFIEQVLSSNYLKMTDSERAEILKEKEEKSKGMISQMEVKMKRYRDIISFRKMQDKVNNRETSF